MEFKKSTVEELIEQDVIEKPMDGNHGSIHPKTKDFTDVGIPFITAADIHSDKVDIEKANKLSEKDAQKLKKGFAKKRDVLLTHKASVGRTAVVNNMEYDYIILSPQVTYYRIKDTTTLLPEYLYLYFKSNYFNQIINQWAGGSTRKYIGITAQKKLPILYPSIKNQKKIVDFIMTFEYKVQVNKKIIANLEELSQTLFKRWFVDFEFPDENGNPYKSSGGDMVESELGVIPKDWSIQTLNDISESYNTKRKPLSKLEREKVASIYPYYGATKIIDYVDDYLFDGKFILVGEDGTVQTEEGHPFVQYVWGQFWVSNHAHILKGKNLSDEVLMLILNNIDIQPYITGAVQPKISKKNLNSIKIVVGSKLIYGKFDQYINTYYKKIREVHDENKYLTQLRDTLLPKLMSGEIEIPDDIEVNEDELSI
ncbi:restriction endonuclease subunit S [Staphylococcus pseudintermedius]|nr:restriction endonuclease subunit S [Staphylococcus pseudintermedius]USH22137.1 restriction endonuclease subunit S [Staphylococcus pseudintermedius]